MRADTCPPGRRRSSLTRTVTRLLAVWALWCWLPAPLALADPRAQATVQPPQFRWTLKKAEDRIDVSLVNDGVIFRITNPSGTGDAAIELTAGRWPRQVSIHFLESSGFLDYFNATNGQTRVDALLRGGRPVVILYDEHSSPLQDQAAAALVVIAYDANTRLMTVRLPPDFGPAAAQRLRVEWIDRFRR